MQNSKQNEERLPMTKELKCQGLVGDAASKKAKNQARHSRDGNDGILCAGWYRSTTSLSSARWSGYDVIPCC
jgi:hypothetical protein